MEEETTLDPLSNLTRAAARSPVERGEQIQLEKNKSLPAHLVNAAGGSRQVFGHVLPDDVLRQLKTHEISEPCGRKERVISM